MKHIQFYFNIESLSADELTLLMESLREEILSHKIMENKYPVKCHVYGAFVDMMNSNHPKTHLVICVPDEINSNAYLTDRLQFRREK